MELFHISCYAVINLKPREQYLMDIRNQLSVSFVKYLSAQEGNRGQVTHTGRNIRPQEPALEEESDVLLE